MKAQHTVFFAIPFDAATRALYAGVAEHLRVEFPTVTVVIGNTELGPSPEFSSIATFKVQNRDLHEQFTRRIMAADIVVADLTHNNPNVHVELGIALRYNKNILRVTGRSVHELGFDIRNLEAHTYRDEVDLRERVSRYLRTFFQIKGLTISREQGDLYRVGPTPIMLRALSGPSQFDHQRAETGAEPFSVRDGGVRVAFEFVQTASPEEWFGIMFRAGDEPLLGSHMVYVRENGAIELALYPGPSILHRAAGAGRLTGPQTVTVEFENDELAVEHGGNRVLSRALVNQVPGTIWLAAWRADVNVSAVEMVSRDTVEWPAEL